MKKRKKNGLPLRARVSARLKAALALMAALCAFCCEQTEEPGSGGGAVETAALKAAIAAAQAEVDKIGVTVTEITAQDAAAQDAAIAALPSGAYYVLTADLATFKAAIAAAEAALADTGAAQTEVDSAAATLERAKTAYLAKVKPANVNTKLLFEKLTDAQQMYDPDIVTEDPGAGDRVPGVWYIAAALKTALANAIAAAESIKARVDDSDPDNEPSAAEVEDAYSALDAALSAYEAGKVTGTQDNRYILIETIQEAWYATKTVSQTTAMDKFIENQKFEDEFEDEGSDLAAYLTDEAQDTITHNVADPLDYVPERYYVPRAAWDAFTGSIAQAAETAANAAATHNQIAAQIAALSGASETFRGAVVLAAVDKTDLSSSITQAASANNAVMITAESAGEVANGAHYVTAAQRKALEDAIDDARAVNDSAAATQREINAQVTALNNARTVFNNAKDTQTGTRAIDKADLETLIASANAAKTNNVHIDDTYEGAKLDNSVYWVTRAEYDALHDAIDAAQDVVDNVTSTQDQYAAQYSALYAALDTFNNTAKELGTGKAAELEALIAQVDRINPNVTMYTGEDDKGAEFAVNEEWVTDDERYALKTTAYNAALNAYNNGDVSTTNAVNAINALRDAITIYNAALKPGTNYVALLKTAIDAANVYKDTYTLSDWEGADVAESAKWVTPAEKQSYVDAIAAADEVWAARDTDTGSNGFAAARTALEAAAAAFDKAAEAGTNLDALLLALITEANRYLSLEGSAESTQVSAIAGDDVAVDAYWVTAAQKAALSDKVSAAGTVRSTTHTGWQAAYDDLNAALDTFKKQRQPGTGLALELAALIKTAQGLANTPASDPTNQSGTLDLTGGPKIGDAQLASYTLTEAPVRAAGAGVSLGVSCAPSAALSALNAAISAAQQVSGNYADAVRALQGAVDTFNAAVVPGLGYWDALDTLNKKAVVPMLTETQVSADGSDVPPDQYWVSEAALLETLQAHSERYMYAAGVEAGDFVAAYKNLYDAFLAVFTGREAGTGGSPDALLAIIAQAQARLAGTVTDYGHPEGAGYPSSTYWVTAADWNALRDAIAAAEAAAAGDPSGYTPAANALQEALNYFNDHRYAGNPNVSVGGAPRVPGALSTQQGVELIDLWGNTGTDKANGTAADYGEGNASSGYKDNRRVVIAMKWSKVDGAEHYNVYRSTQTPASLGLPSSAGTSSADDIALLDQKVTEGAVTKVNTGALSNMTLSFFCPVVENSTTYLWLEAVNVFGRTLSAPSRQTVKGLTRAGAGRNSTTGDAYERGDYFDESNGRNVTTSIGDGQVTLSWALYDRAGWYEVYYKPNVSGTFTGISGALSGKLNPAKGSDYTSTLWADNSGGGTKAANINVDEYFANAMGAVWIESGANAFTPYWKPNTANALAHTGAWSHNDYPGQLVKDEWIPVRLAAGNSGWELHTPALEEAGYYYGDTTTTGVDFRPSKIQAATITIKGLTNDQEYAFALRAPNANGERGVAVCYATPSLSGGGAQTLAGVSNLRVSGTINSTTAKIAWDAVSGASGGYRVYTSRYPAAPSIYDTPAKTVANANTPAYETTLSTFIASAVNYIWVVPITTGNPPNYGPFGEPIYYIAPAAQDDDDTWIPAKPTLRSDQAPLRNFLYVEVNDINPLNAKEYRLNDSGGKDGQGTPFFDVVVLFAANINNRDCNGNDNCSKNGVHLHFNKNVNAILNNKAAYIDPLHNAGMKVVLCILGNHDKVSSGSFERYPGVSWPSGWNYEATQSFAASEAYIDQLIEAMKLYDLDGFDFDDEFSDISGYKNADAGLNLARLMYRLRLRMNEEFPGEHKLLSGYEIGAGANLASGAGYLDSEYTGDALHASYDTSRHYVVTFGGGKYSGAYVDGAAQVPVASIIDYYDCGAEAYYGAWVANSKNGLPHSKYAPMGIAFNQNNSATSMNTLNNCAANEMSASSPYGWNMWYNLRTHDYSAAGMTQEAYMSIASNTLYGVPVKWLGTDWGKTY